MKWAIDLNDIEEFSVEENIMLHAYYVLDALDKLENTENISKVKIEELKQEYYWANTWRKTIKTTDMLAIEDHLRKVCKHHIKIYTYPYHQAWMLDFDETFYERIVKRHFPRLAKKEALSVTKTAIKDL